MMRKNVQRVLISEPPFRAEDAGLPWPCRGKWPARWLQWPDPEANAALYRLRFSVEQPLRVRIHLSGDRKYHFFLDGELCGIGPELGDLNHYFFESFDLELAAGEHWFTALVFDFKQIAGVSEMGLRPGWLLAAQDIAPERFNTGSAPWETLPVYTWKWLRDLSVNPHFELDHHKLPRDWRAGGGDGWKPALPAEYAASSRIRNEFAPERLLEPAHLPERLYRKGDLIEDLWVFDHSSDPVNLAGELVREKPLWKRALTRGVPMELPPGSCRRIIGRLKDYCCFYPRLKVSGGDGSVIRFRWAESLFLHPGFGDDIVWDKGNRNEIDGKYFVTYGHDRFLPDGGDEEFFTPWWRCGRYFEIVIQCGPELLEVGEMSFFETHYPFQSEVTADCSDERINRILPMCLRTLQMCMHDTFMDCPYYEQLMYVGDARLEALTVLAASSDSRLVEKMLRLFAASRRPDGWLYSRYPSRICQIIPTFSPLWIGALHDYALFRGNRKLIRELLGTAKQIIESFECQINRDGLVEFEQGWNFVDWTPGWCRNGNPGVPPGGEYGVSGVVNWLFVYGLVHLADLCDFLGEPLVAMHYRRRAAQQTERLISAFWSEERGLLADDLARNLFSEHSQCLAVLCGTLPEPLIRRIAESLFTAPGLEKTSIYFSHYYFECCRRLRRADALLQRLELLWFDHAGRGLKTLLERAEPSRSDCHGWGCHPYFHIAATLGGIRPGSFGFQSVNISPQLGPLHHLQAQMVHPMGKIEVEYHRTASAWLGKIKLPEGVSGNFYRSASDSAIRLGPGVNYVEWRPAETLRREYAETVPLS